MKHPSLRVVCALSVAAAVSLAAPAVAQAQAQANTLGRIGREQFDDLRYEEAIQTLSAAILRRGNTAAQEVELYELLGLSYLAVNRTEEAEGAFRAVIARDRAHRLDASQAPRVVEFFEAVRQRAAREASAAGAERTLRAVQIEHRSPAEHARNTALTLDAAVTDPDRQAESLVLAWRVGSQGIFHRTAAENHNGRFAAVIAASEVRPPMVEYYLEAVGPDGIAVASRGDALAPLRVMVPAPTEGRATPITSRWWFWTGAAVLVAGVAAGTYFLVSNSGTAEAAPARLTITVTGN